MHSPRALARRLALLLAALLVLAVSGCASLPTSGPVGTSAPDASGDNEFDYAFSPPGPEEGATPRQIIEGFLLAGIAPQDDYNTAREYLTPELAREWQATSRTLVYDSEPNVVGNTGEGRYTVELAVTASIDGHGIMNRNEDPQTESIPLTLERVENEWRIASVPDGTIVEQGNFDVLFSAYPLYFYDSTYAYGIPDYRWYASRPGLAATVVESLLAGPAPYLRNAVFSAFPEGADLSRPAVPVDGRHATVDLEESTFVDATELARQRMLQQLRLTLNGVSNIDTVTMTVNQRPVSLGTVSPEFEQAKVEPGVPNTQIAINDAQLVYYQGDGVVPVGGVPDVSRLRPRDPAMAPGGNRLAFLDGNRGRLFGVGEQGKVTQLASGRALTRPSIDLHGWTWTATGAGGTRISAIPADGAGFGDLREVDAGWMADARVESLRISRDGARAAVVARVDGETGLYITGVIRDSDGTPRGFTDPLRLPATVDVGQVDWVSSSAVIAMRPDDAMPVRAERVGLDGSSEVFQPLLGMTGLSAGPGEGHTVYAETPEGVYSRVSNLWRLQEGHAHDLAYPG